MGEDKEWDLELLAICQLWRDSLGVDNCLLSGSYNSLYFPQAHVTVEEKKYFKLM